MDTLNPDVLNIDILELRRAGDPGRQPGASRPCPKEPPPPWSPPEAATTWRWAWPLPSTSPVEGNAGYFLGGLCGQQGRNGARHHRHGFVGWSVGENLMGGTIRVKGSASQSAGASCPWRPHLHRGRRLAACGHLAQGRHRGHRRRRRRHDRLHGPGRHHPHRGRRRPRPGRLALRGRHLRARALSRRSAPTP